VCAQPSLGLLNVRQVQFPQVNVQNFHQTPLEQLLDTLIVAGFHLLLDIHLPVASGCGKNVHQRFVQRPDFVDMTCLALTDQDAPAFHVVWTNFDSLLGSDQSFVAPFLREGRMCELLEFGDAVSVVASLCQFSRAPEQPFFGLRLQAVGLKITSNTMDFSFHLSTTFRKVEKKHK
jgi:hypothetical protein